MTSSAEANERTPRYMQYRTSLSRNHSKDGNQILQMQETLVLNKNFYSSVGSSGGSNQNNGNEAQTSYQSVASIRNEQTSSIPRYMKYRTSLLQSQSHNESAIDSTSNVSTKAEVQKSKLIEPMSPTSTSPPPRFAERKSGIPRFTDSKLNLQLDERQSSFRAVKNDAISPSRSNNEISNFTADEKLTSPSPYQKRQAQPPDELQPEQLQEKLSQLSVYSKELSSSIPRKTNRNLPSPVGVTSNQLNSRYAKYRTSLTRNVSGQSTSSSALSEGAVDHGAVQMAETAPLQLNSTNSTIPVVNSSIVNDYLDDKPKESMARSHVVNGQLRPIQFRPIVASDSSMNGINMASAETQQNLRIDQKFSGIVQSSGESADQRIFTAGSTISNARIRGDSATSYATSEIKSNLFEQDGAMKSSLTFNNSHLEPQTKQQILESQPSNNTSSNQSAAQKISTFHDNSNAEDLYSSGVLSDRSASVPFSSTQFSTSSESKLPWKVSSQRTSSSGPTNHNSNQAAIVSQFAASPNNKSPLNASWQRTSSPNPPEMKSSVSLNEAALAVPSARKPLSSMIVPTDKKSSASSYLSQSELRISPVPFTSTKFERKSFSTFERKEDLVPPLTESDRALPPVSSSRFEDSKSAMPSFSSSRVDDIKESASDSRTKPMITKSVSFNDDESEDKLTASSVEITPSFHMEADELLPSQFMIAEILNFKTLSDLERIRLRPFLEIWDKIEQDRSKVKMNGSQGLAPPKLASIASVQLHQNRMLPPGYEEEDDRSIGLMDLEQGRKSTNNIGRKSNDAGSAGVEMGNNEENADDASYKRQQMIFQRRLIYCLVGLLFVAVPVAIWVSVYATR